MVHHPFVSSILTPPPLVVFFFFKVDTQNTKFDITSAPLPWA
jgi:hypothetical protein